MTEISNQKGDYWECKECGHIWKTRKQKGEPPSCPRCSSKEIYNSDKQDRIKEKREREEEERRIDRLNYKVKGAERAILYLLQKNGVDLKHLDKPIDESKFRTIIEKDFLETAERDSVISLLQSTQNIPRNSGVYERENDERVLIPEGKFNVGRVCKSCGNYIYKQGMWKLTLPLYCPECGSEDLRKTYRPLILLLPFLIILVMLVIGLLR